MASEENLIIIFITARCHIITVPPKIIEKIDSFGKPSSLTRDTVKAFLVDSIKSKFKITSRYIFQ